MIAPNELAISEGNSVIEDPDDRLVFIAQYYSNDEDLPDIMGFKSCT